MAGRVGACPSQIDAMSIGDEQLRKALPSGTLEIIKDQLYFAPGLPPTTSSLRDNLPFNTFVNDSSLVYTAFFADFGPLDLGLTCKFCKSLTDALQSSSSQRKALVYYYGDSGHARSNCAVLVCAYQIFVLSYTVEQAYAPFIGIQPAFAPFRDAGFCVNTFPLTVLDCARAMRKAVRLGHFHYKTFSVQTFQNLAKLQNGDVSWIIPGKFIAFSGPLTNRRKIGQGVYTLSPEQYVPLFKSLGVSCVVRFNDKCYDRKVFQSNGIRHVDLFYEDGGNPSDQILQSFLQLCENERGAIAVHCKAGLGRTGTNIAAYMIKHFGYTAKESIAWCRLCRPGSIVGPQQQYLAYQEERLLNEGSRLGISLPLATAAALPPSSELLATNKVLIVTNDSTTSTASSSCDGVASNGYATAPTENGLGARRALSAVRQYRSTHSTTSPAHSSADAVAHELYRIRRRGFLPTCKPRQRCTRGATRKPSQQPHHTDRHLEAAQPQLCGRRSAVHSLHYYFVPR